MRVLRFLDPITGSALGGGGGGGGVGGGGGLGGGLGFLSSLTTRGLEDMGVLVCVIIVVVVGCGVLITVAMVGPATPGICG